MTDMKAQPFGESISSVQGDINISEDPNALETACFPYTGIIMPITAVPDEAFKSRAMGDGFAVDLNNGEIIPNQWNRNQYILLQSMRYRWLIQRK